MQFGGQLRVSRERLDRPSAIAALLETWDRESKITQNWWADTAAEKKRFKELICRLHASFHAATVEPYLAAVAAVRLPPVDRAAHAGAGAAADERRRLNSLNYGDLLNLTARVLRENAEVRRALQQKYRYLFVDEFQDTDPVQAEIVFLLAADEKVVGRTFRSADSAADADWRHVPLRPGALFVVGDPKQSIYRFRRADIDIYNVVRERFSEPGTGRVLPLTMNFRSVPELCQWANDVFETRFPEEPTAQSPRFAPLDPKDARRTSPTRRRKSPRAVCSRSRYACDQRDVIDEDADRIARYIRAEVDAGRRNFSDFLILTRKKKTASRRTPTRSRR